MLSLTEGQERRYARHLILKEVGLSGQTKLLTAKVLIIGAGGLGSPAALYLAAAGVGTIGLVDPDVVELSDLQRQILYSTPDLGQAKVLAGAAALQRLNQDTQVVTYQEAVTPDNIEDIIRDYDFVIDGTDNLAAKFLVNDACIKLGVPYSHAGIVGLEGQLMTVIPGAGACYRCVFEAPPPPDAIPSCSQAGVLGVIAGVIGTLQATEALKYLLGIGELLTGSLLIYDARTAAFRRVSFRPRAACPACGSGEPKKLGADYRPPVCGGT